MMEENGLPKGWVETTLGEVSNISTGFPFKSKKYSDSGELRVVRGENVSLKKLRWDNAKYWNHSTENLEQYLLDEDDIVIGMDGSRIGKNKSSIPTSELPLILAQRVARVKANKNTYQGFLKYCILNEIFERYIIKVQTGTSIPHISLNQIRDYDIIIPERLQEQQAIATILTSFDDKIELLQAQNETLEATAQTIFKEWFGKYQVGDELPEGWRIGELGDVAYNHSKSFKFTNENVVFINTGDVLEGQFLHFDKISPHGLPGQAKKAIEMYDILYSEIRPKNKRFAFVDFTVDDYVVSTKFMIIRPIDDFSPFILYLILKSQSTINEFNTVAESRSGTFPQITFESIKNFPIVIPNSKAQSDFEKNLIPIMDKKKINHQQIQTLQQTRDTLLPKLMSGKVRVDEFKE